ncbi:hypothetical protein BC628DRAFT_822697 [Trametes gibbosa]|nr:hypothetical protein BC628DRAFT_822697 [Trametes gibbosa]
MFWPLLSESRAQDHRLGTAPPCVHHKTIRGGEGNQGGRAVSGVPVQITPGERRLTGRIPGARQPAEVRGGGWRKSPGLHVAHRIPVNCTSRPSEPVECGLCAHFSDCTPFLALLWTAATVTLLALCRLYVNHNACAPRSSRCFHSAASFRVFSSLLNTD